MMKAAQIARERGIPYFGICYGFQWATVEYARNVAGLADADSTECNPDTPTKVIYKLRDLLGVDDLGGTMRLGSYACELTPGSLAQRVYGATLDSRAPPPPLRVQLPVRAHAHRARPAHLRPIARRQVRRDRRAARPSVVSRRAVPPRVQVEADAAASAVRRVRRRASYQHKTAKQRALSRRQCGQVEAQVRCEANVPARSPALPARSAHIMAP